MNSLSMKPFFFCILFSIAAFGCSGQGPADTVDQFHRLIESGENSEAISMVGGEVLSLLPPAKLQAAMGQQTQEIASKGGIDSVEILSEEITGQTAVVRSKTHYKDGTISDEEVIQLTKIDGAWMLTPEMKK